MRNFHCGKGVAPVESTILPFSCTLPHSASREWSSPAYLAPLRHVGSARSPCKRGLLSSCFLFEYQQATTLRMLFWDQLLFCTAGRIATPNQIPSSIPVDPFSSMRFLRLFFFFARFGVGDEDRFAFPLVRLGHSVWPSYVRSLMLVVQREAD